MTVERVGDSSDPRTPLPSSRSVSLFDDFPSRAMRELLSQARQFGRDPDAPILLEGESGTGKTRLARFLHANSRRASAPFEELNLSSAHDGLAAAELFGHERGAFTGAARSRKGRLELAHNGTLFLDEFSRASIDVQRLLLGCVEEGMFRPLGATRDVSVNVRVIAATSTSFADLEASSDFLPDLLARFETFRLRLPPLRERADDIPILVHHYVRLQAPRIRPGRPLPAIEPDLLSALSRAPWPRNLRQLEMHVRLLLTQSDDAPVLTLEHCSGRLRYLRDYAPDGQPSSVEGIVALIHKTGSLSAAARRLGVDRKTLRTRMQRLSDRRDR